MTFQVVLRPSGRTFSVADGETVLAAGLAAGANLPYSCRAGMCRTCRGTVIEGKVDYGSVEERFLTAEHRAKGLALLCQAKPLSDVVIEIQELKLQGAKPKMLPCRVLAITRPAPDVAIVSVKLPMNEPLQFVAGQYVEFILKDGRRRSYSIANAPQVKGITTVELHIRHLPGGAFTDHVFSTMKERDLLRMEAPLGTFFLREESDKPVIFAAAGTGFAPIKSIIELMLEQKSTRPIVLYWGCRARQDLYLPDLPMQWAREHPGLRYVPVLSEPRPEDGWDGRTGLVHRAVMEDFPDLSGHQVYACGSPLMVEAARNEFSARCALPEDEFFADAFLTEADHARA
jgi:CDP-4-dehydro-6-deoxyglucose reductase, E3